MKCNKDEFCALMQSVLEDNNHKGKGFKRLLCLKVDFTIECKGITYKTSEKKRSPILLEYCPFCGEKINFTKN